MGYGRAAYQRIAIGFCAAVVAGPASAHHPTGGRTPATVADGLLSGLGHPVIGLDHLAFVIGLGGLAGLAATRRFGLIPAFVFASMLGVVAHAGRLDLPAAEALVAGSLLVAGLALLVQRGLAGALAIMLAAAAGLVHGYAHGEAIVGAEATPLLAYLAGLAIVQTAIAAVVLFATRVATDANPFALGRLRFAGTALAALGAVNLALVYASP